MNSLNLAVRECIAVVIVVSCSKISKRAIFPLLRCRKARRKRVLKGCVLGDVVIQSGYISEVIIPGRPAVLPVGGEVHPVVNARPAAHDRLVVQPVGEAEPRPDVVVSGIRMPEVIRRQYRGSENLPAREIRCGQGRDVEAAVASEVPVSG